MNPPSIALIVLLLSQTLVIAQPGSLTSLPIGSRSNITAQIERTVSAFSLACWTPADTLSRYVAYTNSMGSLESVMRTNMYSMFSSLVTPGDAGKEAKFHFWIWFHSPKGDLSFDGSDGSSTMARTNFTIAFDGQGALVIPYASLLYATNTNSIFSWSPIGWVPVPGAGVGVEQVDLFETNAFYGLSHLISSKCGANGCSTLETLDDGNLYLDIMQLDTADVTNQSVYSLQTVTLHHSVVGGQRDVFDAKTGLKMYSTLIRMNAAKTNGLLRASIKAWPSKQVAIETSSNLKNWNTSVSGSPITLDTNGNGTITLSNALPLFVRGRLISP